MLDNISAHLHSDEAIQLDIEAKAAERLRSTFDRNRRAFKRNVPAMRQQIEQLAWFNLGIFCNKNGEYNIVDKATGRTFYGLHVSNEIQTQYDNRRLNAPRHQFQTPQSKPSSGLSEQIDAIVILGIGIGHHIGQILALHQVKHCIIYEPDAQLFFASLLCFDWQKLLADSSEKKVSIYFQVGQNGSNIVADLKELSEHAALNSVCMYKHYNSPTFNAIEREFRLKSWHELKHSGVQWSEYSDQAFVLPNWSTPSCLAQWQDVTAKSDPQFLKNIEAFKRYFPKLASEFADYQPQHWHPCRNTSGDINLRSIQFPETYHGDYPKQEGLENYQVFARYPNKDGLVLGYDGTKLKEYTHYRFVSATESLIEELEEQQAALPEALKAIIVFGLTSGYSLESLLNEHSVENLFICEPEPDFFYASLFAIDWDKILTDIDVNEGRIYINIGDNSMNLFRDLISQFYAIGPYLLVNTFFYQTYYREDLVEAVNQLRQQLQVVIAMGEYYDHARYGIAHTVEMIERGTPFLRKKPSEYLSYETREAPVFIVGNGPSLDQSIDIIKSHRGEAIVVSCGTALQVLYKNGILPDYHAEIEQNRSTYDWVSRSSAVEFTKQITLVSCNGIHPDTCQLFKKVQLAFKEGESSTVSNLNILGEGNWQKLEFAFPTVTNFVINLFLEMSFTQLYLLGVDLGFVDDKTHHSKQSGYYDSEGNELYDYSEKNRTTIQVAGNFRNSVLTKYEFKVSKEIIEQSLIGRTVDCFNCSDGVRIAGTIPLQLDSILLVADSEQKQQALFELHERAFIAIPNHQQYLSRFEEKYQHDRFLFEIDYLIGEANKALDGEIQLDALMEQQKKLLHDSYQLGRSLSFYLLYGTSNYVNAVFSKLLAVSSNEESSLEPAVKQALESWIKALSAIRNEYGNFPNAFDFVSSMHIYRERKMLLGLTATNEVFFLCDSSYKTTFVEWFSSYSGENSKALAANDLSELPLGSCLLVLNNFKDMSFGYSRLELLLGRMSTIRVIIGDEGHALFEYLKNKFPQHEYVLLLSIDPIRTSEDMQEFVEGNRAFHFDELTVGALARASLIPNFSGLVLPKLRFAKASKETKTAYYERLYSKLSKFDYCCEFQEYFIAAESQHDLVEFDGVGNRGRPFKICRDLFNPFRAEVNKSSLSELVDKFNSGYLGGVRHEQSTED